MTDDGHGLGCKLLLSYGVELDIIVDHLSQKIVLQLCIIANCPTEFPALNNSSLTFFYKHITLNITKHKIKTSQILMSRSPRLASHLWRWWWPAVELWEPVGGHTPGWTLKAEAILEWWWTIIAMWWVVEAAHARFWRLVVSWWACSVQHICVGG